MTIEGKRQTGTYVNEQPRAEFDFLVLPEGLPAYRVKKKVTVPLTSLGEIRFGDGFPRQGGARRAGADPDRLERADPAQERSGPELDR